MSTINFNLKNKDENQIKNEILSKMSKIRQNYDNDNSYQELFYNVVANSNNKSNLKLSINKEGLYNLKVGGNGPNGNGPNGNGSNGNGSKGNVASGFLNFSWIYNKLLTYEYLLPKKSNLYLIRLSF